MSRIPYPDLERAHPKLREAYDALPARINLFHMLVHAEHNFRPLLELGGTILARQRLDAKLREHAILLVAKLSGAEYEWVQHVPIALGTGATQAQVDAIEREDLEADCFDASEQAVLHFAREVLRDVRPSDAALAAVRAHLSDAELVELTLAVGFYMMIARLMETTGVDVDAPAGAQIVAQLADTKLPTD